MYAISLFVHKNTFASIELDCFWVHLKFTVVSNKITVFFTG